MKDKEEENVVQDNHEIPVSNEEDEFVPPTKDRIRYTDDGELIDETENDQMEDDDDEDNHNIQEQNVFEDDIKRKRRRDIK